MRRTPSLVWTPERNGPYTDHLSRCGHWWIAEGFDEHLRKLGKPFLLLHARDFSAQNARRWRRVDGFASVREAKHFAEEMTE